MPARALTLAAWLGLAVTGRSTTPGAVVIETPAFRYTLAPTGTNIAFVDLATGVNHLRTGPPSPCATVRVAGREHPATAVRREGDALTLQFADVDTTVGLGIETRPQSVRWTVRSVSGAAVESLVFLNVPLELAGRPEEPFGACALSLNLQTRVDALPVLQTELRAGCQAKSGLVGARAAVVAGPPGTLLAALQTELGEGGELPVCRVAGPWARQIPFNHGSYLFNFGTLVETNVDDWIGRVRSLGFTQVDHHGGGGFFRFGDLELNRRMWPQGWDTFSNIVARLHGAGIGSILHTYAFFIDKQSSHVTPVPDPRLDAFRVFTLAAPVGAEATEIEVRESTAGMSTVTGFFEHNSVVLHIGDELVTFSGFTREAPWRFTGVKRGALATRAAAHAAGDRARHLKECFGLFVPDPESSLFEEIAARHADVVNQGGFDGIYLDAIDGSSILRGPDECWYWANKFVVDIQKRLRRPVGMEMSAMWHHFWRYRTRWQAWDYPQRGQKRFVDLHAASVNGGLMLPLHLGWWNFQTFDPPQIEPSYPDVMEHLGARLIGWDAGISLTGAVDRERLRTVPLVRRAAEILRTCEELRHAGVFDASARAQLREPDATFALVTTPDGNPGFCRAGVAAHTAAAAEPWTLSWTITNRFDPQPVRLRIEALMSGETPEHTNALALVDSDPLLPATWVRSSAAGVTIVEAAPPAGAAAPAGGALCATNAGAVPQSAAWARWRRPFEPTLDLRERRALGAWVEGDGSGALLAIRLESPHHLAFGAVADRYLPLDFTGRRFVTLVETESDRWSDYTWNDGRGLYNLYRETIDFAAVESVSLWLQNLPPGRETRCRVGPLAAVPMVPGTVSRPAVTIGDRTVVFPVTLPAGSWIEANGPDNCAVFSPSGERLQSVTLEGAWPELASGPSTVQFRCEPAPGPSPRARVVVFSRGPAVPRTGR